MAFCRCLSRRTQDALTEGLSEDLGIRLSKFAELLVIAENSAARFKDGQADTKSIGNELGARYLVRGTVRSEADRMRVNVQLLQASTGGQIWAEQYDREWTGGQDS